MYNVEVDGKLVWIEWTTNRRRAMREYRAWRRMARLTGKNYYVRVVFALAHGARGVQTNDSQRYARQN